MRIHRYHARLLLAASAIAIADASEAGETVTYTYDALGRLTATSSSGAVNNGVATSIGYDPAGNRSNYTVASRLRRRRHLLRRRLRLHLRRLHRLRRLRRLRLRRHLRRRRRRRRRARRLRTTRRPRSTTADSADCSTVVIQRGRNDSDVRRRLSAGAGLGERVGFSVVSPRPTFKFMRPPRGMKIGTTLSGFARSDGERDPRRQTSRAESARPGALRRPREDRS